MWAEGQEHIGKQLLQARRPLSRHRAFVIALAIIDLAGGWVLDIGLSDGSVWNVRGRAGRKHSLLAALPSHTPEVMVPGQDRISTLPRRG